MRTAIYCAEFMEAAPVVTFSDSARLGPPQAGHYRPRSTYTHSELGPVCFDADQLGIKLPMPVGLRSYVIASISFGSSSLPTRFTRRDTGHICKMSGAGIICYIGDLRLHWTAPAAPTVQPMPKRTDGICAGSVGRRRPHLSQATRRACRSPKMIAPSRGIVAGVAVVRD